MARFFRRAARPNKNASSSRSRFDWLGNRRYGRDLPYALQMRYPFYAAYGQKRGR